MKVISNSDYASIVRILKEVEGMPSATDKERNRARVAKQLRKKFEKNI